MLHYSRVIQGIMAFVDNEIVKAMAGSWKAWVVGGMAGIAAAKAEQIFDQYKSNALLTSMCLIEGENINIDLIHAELRKQAQRGTATVTVPIIGPITFNSADVEKLFHYIRG